MARNFAKLHSSTWTDEHFKSSLSVDAQWLYFVLLSQANINAAGVLPLQDRKWRKLARGHTPQRIAAALAELQAYWYVIVDEDTEEVLIRSFIRGDGIWKQPNVLKGALGHAKTTMSETLKAVIWHEVDRLPLEELEAEREAKTRTLIETLRPTLTGTLPEGFMEPPVMPSITPFEVPEQQGNAAVISITRSVQEEPQVDDSQPTLPDALWEGFGEGFPEPSGAGTGTGVGTGAGKFLVERGKDVSETSSPGDTSKKPKAPKPDHPLFVEFWTPYPKKTKKDRARTAWKKAIKNGADPQDLITGSKLYGQMWEGATKEELDYAHNPVVWLDDQMWDGSWHMRDMSRANGGRRLKAVSGDNYQPHSTDNSDFEGDF